MTGLGASRGTSKSQAARARLALRLRLLADRLDWYGAPKLTGLTIALEEGRGWVLRRDGTGVPVWYYGNADYERAWDPAKGCHGQHVYTGPQGCRCEPAKAGERCD